MARWRLLQPHYLNVKDLDGEPVEWQYEETNRDTGRRARKRFPVPLLLDPNDPGFHKPRGGGQITVCQPGKGTVNDYEFVNGDGSPGLPTPEMEPMDDEALAITEAQRPKWKHPMSESALPGVGGFNETLLQTLTQQLEGIIRTNGIPKAIENQAVPNAEVEALRAMVQQLQAQMAELIAAKEGIKPVEDDGEVLPPTHVVEPVATIPPAGERRV